MRDGLAVGDGLRVAVVLPDGAGAVVVGAAAATLAVFVAAAALGSARRVDMGCGAVAVAWGGVNPGAAQASKARNGRTSRIRAGRCLGIMDFLNALFCELSIIKQVMK
jgi:hypothetical protein